MYSVVDYFPFLKLLRQYILVAENLEKNKEKEIKNNLKFYHLRK